MIFFTRILALSGLISLFALLYNASLLWIALSFFYYKIIVGLFGNQIAQHRYFSHNSFQTTRLKKYLLYFTALTTGVNPLNYAIVHRHHHVHSDTVKDIHSWYNGWPDIFSPITFISSYKEDIKFSRVLDKDLMPLYKWHMHMLTVFMLCLLLLDYQILVYIFLAGIGWNYVHMILFRVWLVHYKLPGSYRNFETKDRSYNNKFIQCMDIGEGLHNNHHAYPNRYDQAVQKGEFDPVGFIVRSLLVKE